MDYLGLFSPYHLAALHDWISQTGELYIHLEYPHSGGSGTSYLIRTLDDLKQLILAQAHPEIEIFIFRSMPFPVRGLADDSLLERAIQTIPDGQWYTIASLDYYPLPCDFLGGGKSHEELRKEFSEVGDKLVGVGANPFDVDYIDDKWLSTNTDEIMYFIVRKNLNFYEPYDRNPGKYEEVIGLWPKRV